jgi:hypothetical protein
MSEHEHKNESWRKYKVGDRVTMEEIEESGMTGYVRGEYFSSEWLDGSCMAGYGIYYVLEGAISEYGDFSESGKVEDAEDAGDLMSIAYEKNDFEILSFED